MKFYRNTCHTQEKPTKEKGLLVGFILSIFTILWHLLHCGLPLIMPVFILLNIPMPAFLHHVKIPFIFTVISILWIIYYLLHKRIVIYRIHPFHTHYKAHK